MRGLRIPCHIYAEIILRKLVDIVRRSGCDCIAISGGIDTTLVLLAARIAGLKLRGYSAYYRDGIPKDLPYITYVAKRFGISVTYVAIDRNDVERLVKDVVKCIGKEKLDSHGDGGCIEIRNDIVFYAVLKKAKEDGCKCVFVGSGGDEVFAGYSFMLKLKEDELIKARERASRGRFPEIELAKCLNVEVSAPLLAPELLSIALDMPAECLRSQRMKGKEVLRSILKSYGLYFVGDRDKTPAEEGAGTKEICRSIYDEQ